jgi:hypothetical protein
MEEPKQIQARAPVEAAVTEEIEAWGVKVRMEEPKQFQARAFVEAAVAQEIEAWGATVGLTHAHPRFAQFSEDMTKALLDYMLVHNAGTERTYERFSDMRADFMTLKKAATTAAKMLRDVERILKRLPPMMHVPEFRLGHDPCCAAWEQDELAKAAGILGDQCKVADRGGPSRLRAFATLAEGLVRAYRNATGEAGTGRSAREGRLLDLYEAVLPTADKLAKTITGKPLEISKEPGEYLHRTAERLRVS